MKIPPRLYRLYPELAFFSSDDERLATLKAFRRRFMRKPSFWVACLGFGVVNALVISRGSRLFIPGLPGFLPRELITFFVTCLLGACWGLSFQYLWRRPAQRSLREHLLARGVPICLHCGYDLRGQSEPRCPECGQPFDPSLISPRQSES